MSVTLSRCGGVAKKTPTKKTPNKCPKIKPGLGQDTAETPTSQRARGCAETDFHYGQKTSRKKHQTSEDTSKPHMLSELGCHLAATDIKA